MVFSDIKGTDLALQNDISYFRNITKHFIIKVNLSIFERDGSTDYFINPNKGGYIVTDRNQREVEIGFGYKRFHLQSSSFYRVGFSGVYRSRDDKYTGFYAGGGTGWHESYTDWWSATDFGVSLWGDYNVFVGKHTTVGAYLRQGWYSTGPESMYYGVQFGYQF
jgi:hypothetical protein